MAPAVDLAAANARRAGYRQGKHWTAAVDDLASAAQGGDKAAAKEAWSRGRDYLNSYLRIVNYPIISRVGDKFSVVEGSL